MVRPRSSSQKDVEKACGNQNESRWLWNSLDRSRIGSSARTKNDELSGASREKCQLTVSDKAVGVAWKWCKLSCITSVQANGSVARSEVTEHGRVAKSNVAREKCEAADVGGRSEPRNLKSGIRASAMVSAPCYRVR